MKHLVATLAVVVLAWAWTRRQFTAAGWEDPAPPKATKRRKKRKGKS